MEKIRSILRLIFLIFLMVLASIGLSITGAAPTLPKDKETYIEDESRNKKSKKKEIRNVQMKSDINKSG
jgi:hypothetical protein